MRLHSITANARRWFGYEDTVLKYALVTTATFGGCGFVGPVARLPADKPPWIPLRAMLTENWATKVLASRCSRPKVVNTGRSRQTKQTDWPLRRRPVTDPEIRPNCLPTHGESAIRGRA